MTEDLSVLTRPAREPDEVIAYGTHADQIADVRRGKAGAERRPLVLFVHGGFWRPQYDRSGTCPLADAIASAGWTVASIEYRRTPGEPDETLADAGNALLTLPARISGHRGGVILLGHSAGGHLVLWLTVTRGGPPLVGTLALAPAADLRLAHELNLGDGAVLAFLGADPSTRPDLDPRRLSAPEIPTTILHGDQDDVVPLSVTASYAAAHPSVRVVRLPGVGHFAPIDPLSTSWDAVLEELRRLSR